MERLLNLYDSELLSRFMKRGERAGNGPREVHLPLIVTKADGMYRCRTKKVITVLHKRTGTVVKLFLRSKETG